MKNWKAIVAGGVIAIAAIWAYAEIDEPDTAGEHIDDAVEEFNDEVDDNT